MRITFIQRIIDKIRVKEFVRNNLASRLRAIEIECNKTKIVLNNYTLKHDETQKELETDPDYQWQQTIRSLLKVMDVKNHTDHFVRVGRDNDGGYVMFDEFAAGSVAYSFGISNDVSWDKDIANRNIDIYMYDHTIEKLPEENSRFHFFRNGITGNKSQKSCKTMAEYIIANGHNNQNNLVLKMDVEGAEWDFLNQVESNTLGQFSQMVFEFHEMARGQYDNLICPALEKINKTHQLVHIHANNFGNIKLMGNRFLPDTFEVTYLRRSDHEFAPCSRSFPTRWDQPCNPLIPDIYLGSWG
ncbi:MAG: FkbM family methyltransferase [Thermoguttaceae bacterium]